MEETSATLQRSVIEQRVPSGEMDTEDMQRRRKKRLKRYKRSTVLVIGICMLFVSGLFAAWLIQKRQLNRHSELLKTDVPSFARVFGVDIETTDIQAYTFNGKRYVRVYMAVYDNVNGFPNHKDIWQDSKGNILFYSPTKPFKRASTLFIGFGTPKRQKAFAEKYKEQGDKRIGGSPNYPLVRSCLVEEKYVLSIMENSVQEKFSSIATDINVDTTKAANQFGLQETSVELLRQNALSGSLITYCLDPTKNEDTASWGQVKSFEDLTENDSPLESVSGNKIEELQKQSENNKKMLQKRLKLVSILESSKLFFSHDKYINNDEYNRAKSRLNSLFTTDRWDYFRLGKLENNDIKYYRKSLEKILTNFMKFAAQHNDKHFLTEINKYTSALSLVKTHTNDFTYKIEIRGGQFNTKNLSPGTLALTPGVTVVFETQSSFVSEETMKQISLFVKRHFIGQRFSKLRVVLAQDRTDTYIKAEKKHLRRKLKTLLPKIPLYLHRLNDHLDETGEAYTSRKVEASQIHIEINGECHVFLPDRQLYIEPDKRQFGSIINIVDGNVVFQSDNQLQYIPANDVFDYFNGKKETIDKLSAWKKFSDGQQRTGVVLIPGHVIAKKEKRSIVKTAMEKIKNLPVEIVKDTALESSATEEATSVIKTCGRNTRRKRSSCFLYEKNLPLLEDSFDVKDNKLILGFEEKGKSGIKYHKSVDIPPSMNALSNGRMHTMYKISKSYGYGSSAQGFLAAMYYFETGRETDGGFTMAQSIYNVGELAGINNKMEMLLFKSGKKLVHKFIAKASASAVTKLSKFAKAMKNIPIIGTVFDVYSIGSTIRDLTEEEEEGLIPLHVFNLMFDISSAVLSLNPVTAPVGMALSLVQNAVSSFYTNIFEELKHAEGKDALEKIFAVAEGIDKGFVDFYTFGLRKLNKEIYKASEILRKQRVLPNFSGLYAFLHAGLMNILEAIKDSKGKDSHAKFQMIIKAISNTILDTVTGSVSKIIRDFLADKKQLEEHFKLNTEFLRNLSKIESYFKIIKQNDGDFTIDFTSGESSAYGGFVHLTLLNDYKYEIEILNVPSTEGPKTLKKTFAGNISDIILGIGQSEYLKTYGTTWLKFSLFKVKDFRTFEFASNPSTLFGKYTGNQLSNTFVAVRGTHSPTSNDICSDKFSDKTTNERLRNYTYFLNGKEGNDLFLLGPQTFHIKGGKGHDSYYVPWYGGLTTIDNFAEDIETDTLFLNISHNLVKCRRVGIHLNISYCNGVVLLRDWFIHTGRYLYQHLRIITNDGMTLSPVETEQEVECYPVSLHLSGKLTKQFVDLTISKYRYVFHVVGSSFSDTIIGNGNSNIFNGGLGQDTITGGSGNNVYLVMAGEGCDTINITSNEGGIAKISFEAKYINIKTRQISRTEFHIFDKSDMDKTCLTILDTNEFSDFKRITIFTLDYFILKIARNELYKELAIISETLDFGLNEKGISVNLLYPKLGSFEIDGEHGLMITTIFDTKFEDKIVGNNKNNIFTCSGGSRDYLEGNGGRDFYLIRQGCSFVRIMNFDLQETMDKVVINSSFSSLQAEIYDLSLKISSGYVSIVIIDWFVNSSYQHLILETKEGIIIKLPLTIEEFENQLSTLSPLEINMNDQFCQIAYREEIDLNVGPWITVRNLVAKSKPCVKSAVGNRLGNKIDLGTTNLLENRDICGGNGSDTYIVGTDYGQETKINNFALDKFPDFLLFEIPFEEIEIGNSQNDILISSNIDKNSTRVRILSFLEGTDFQHMLLITSDGVTIQILESYPYKRVLQVDKIASSKPLIINENDTEFRSAVKIMGSGVAKNKIMGGNYTVYISGGKTNDILYGGENGEIIKGFGGDDIIEGGNGDDILFGDMGDDYLNGGEGADILYGGYGADILNGGEGSDSIVFSGNGELQLGVIVDLFKGYGKLSDAEGDVYSSISNVYGTEYDDRIYGNDDDNVILTYQGNDYIYPMGGNDVLDGGMGNDTYNCSGATGKKEILFGEDSKSFDLIIFDSKTINDLCMFIRYKDIIITDKSIKELGNKLEITIVNGFQQLHLKQISVIYNEEVIDDSIRSTCSVDSAVEQFYEYMRMYVLDVKETEVVLYINGSYLYEKLTCGTELDFKVVSESTRTKLDISSFISYDVISIGNLLPGTRYNITLALTKCTTNIASISIQEYTLPESPRDCRAFNIHAIGFTLTWVSLNSLNLTFDLKIKPVDEKHTFYYSLNDSEVVVSSLSPNTNYSVEIRVIKDGYKSESSTLFVATTDICQNLTLPKHGYIKSIDLNKNGYYTAELDCFDGFKPIGNKSQTCKQPSSDFLCIQKKCVIPEGFDQHGKIIWHQHDVYGKWKATWICDDGYEVSPWRSLNIAVCEKGVWKSKLLKCQIIRYCHMPRLPNDLTNGGILRATYPPNASIEVSCKRGFKMVGPWRIFCQGPAWTDFPVCEQLYCPHPNGIKNGHYECNMRRGHKIVQDVTCHLICKQYFFPESSTMLHQPSTTCDNGEWTPALQNCVPVIQILDRKHFLFFSLDHVALNSKLIHRPIQPRDILSHIPTDLGCTLADDYSSGMSRLLTQTYNDYKKMTDSTILKCQRKIKFVEIFKYYGSLQIFIDNTWKSVCINSKQLTIANEVCKRIYGQYTTHIAKGYTFRTTYVAERSINHKMFRLVESQRQCDAFISCRQRCARPPIYNGMIIECGYHQAVQGQSNYFYENEKICYLCNTGYITIGSGILTCTSDGNWSDRGECELQIKRYETVTEGGSASFSCNEGQWVKILEAKYYGSFAFFNFYSWGDCEGDSDVTSYARAYCKYQRFCNLPASNSILGDTCDRVKKTLEVVAHCEDYRFEYLLLNILKDLGFHW